MDNSPGFVVGQLTFYVVLGVGIVWLIVYLVRRPRGAATAQARWTQAVQTCSTDPRFRFGQVTSAQDYPQRGTAAWVTWYGTGQQQNVWFEQVYPRPGGWVVVTGAPRPGVPGADPTTFYVDRVYDIIY